FFSLSSIKIVARSASTCFVASSAMSFSSCSKFFSEFSRHEISIRALYLSSIECDLISALISLLPMKQKAFSAFPDQGLQFLHSLKRNNNRDWFHSHKSTYEQYVKQPMTELIAALAQE